MKVKVLIGIAALAVVGGGAASLMLSTSSTSPLEENLSFIPGDAALYLDAYIDPTDEQKGAIDNLLAKFPEEAGTFDKAKERLIEVLDPELDKLGLSYEEDVAPWVGDQAAFFLLAPVEGEDPSGAIVVKTDDEDAALKALEDGFGGADLGTPSDPVEHAGATYRTVDVGEEVPTAYAAENGYLIVGDEAGVKASLSAPTGESLEESDAFERATGDLPEDRLLTFFIDGERFLDAVGQAPDLSAEDQEGLEAMEQLGGLASSSVSLTVQDGAVLFDSSSDISNGGIYTDLAANLDGEGPLGQLPGESWFAFGFPNVGETMTSFLESFAEVESAGFDLEQIESDFQEETGLDLREDVLSWMGDAGFFVQGTNIQEVGGGLVMESSDADKAQAALAKLREAIESEEPVSEFQANLTQDLETDAGTGFSFQAPGQPAPVRFVAGDRVIIAYGDDAFESAVSGEDALSDADAYAGALELLDDDFAPLFYADIQTIRTFAEAALAFGGQAQNPTYTEEVRPWLEPLTYAVAGVRTEDDTVFQRFVIGTE